MPPNVTGTDLPVKAAVARCPLENVALDMMGIIIFVHGVNSTGEWYDKMEKNLCVGLGARLMRKDLEPKINSPVIRFYWGYSAPRGLEKKYRIPLRDTKGRSPLDLPEDALEPPYYWGGGPFVNGTTDLRGLWSDKGFKKRVLGIFNLQWLNNMADRQLEDAPPRTYYVHAVKRLADLVDKIREKYPADTVTLMAHSQGTMLAMAATLMCANRAPDGLFLMNSPYRLEDKVLDSFQWDLDRSTTKARVSTFEAVAKRMEAERKDYRQFEAERKKTRQVDDCLNVGRMEESSLWRADASRANGAVERGSIVPERSNSGRLYVYFNPHDRVMGLVALESIGWKGVPETLLKRNTNVYQRMLARSTPCGDVPGEKNFGTLPPISLKDGSEINSFWSENDTVLKMKLWTVPDPKQKVHINAEQVPRPVSAAQQGGFDELRRDGNQWVKEPEFKDFLLIATPEAYVDEIGMEGQNIRVLETREQMRKRLETYVPFPTNHSTLPRSEAFSEQVVSYDLPIGFCDSHKDTKFWAELVKDANWESSTDPYFNSGALPDYPASQMPPAIDRETVGQVTASKSNGELP